MTSQMLRRLYISASLLAAVALTLWALFGGSPVPVFVIFGVGVGCGMAVAGVLFRSLVQHIQTRQEAQAQAPEAAP